MSQKTIFSEVRTAHLSTVAVFLGLHVALKAVFFSSDFLDLVADPIYDLTHGVFTHSASAGFVEIVFLGSFLLVIGGLRLSDVGLRRSLLLNGLLITGFVWSLCQTFIVFASWIDGGALDFGHPWRPFSSALWAGLLDAHVGSAFVEEAIYRGFLLPQVFVILRRWSSWSVARSLVASITISQVYFAAWHIPAALRTAASGPEILFYLLQVFLVGILFAAVYLRTGNLFVGIGIHALLNFPGALFVSGTDPFLVVLVTACVILVAWPYLNRTLSDVFTMRPSTADLRLAADSAHNVFVLNQKSILQ